MSTDKRERQRSNRDAARVQAAHEAQAQARQRRIVYGGIVIIVLVIAAILITQLSGDDTTADGDSDIQGAIDDEIGEGDADAAADPEPAESTTSQAAPTTQPGASSLGCPAEDGSSVRTIDFDGPQPMCIDPNQTHEAVFDTSEGEVRVALDTATTPLTVNNFVTLVRWGYYDGTTIFRSDPSIDIIQGGSPHTESPSDPGPGYSIPDEPEFDFDAATGRVTGPYAYVPGQLVMARSGGPNAAGAQYFFTTGPEASLLDGQGSYVVFGTTDDDGLGVLQGIIGLHEPGGNLGGAPSRTVTVNSVTIEVS